MKEQWREIVLIVFVIALSIFLFSNNAQTVSENIIITEICPSGCATNNHQWIEIYNKSTGPVDLSGWKFFEEGINHGLAISPSGTIQTFVLDSGHFAIIAQNDAVFIVDHPGITSTVFDSSWTTLNKTGEEIGIKKGSGTEDVIEKFVYTSINNFSLERVKADGDPNETLSWKEHPNGSSAGIQNYWWEDGTQSINHIPIAHIEAPNEAEIDEEVVFDGNESTDFEGGVVEYQWTIENVLYEGVSVSHIFTTTGTKQVVLTVFDSEGASSTVSDSITIVSPDLGSEDDTRTSTSKLFINEFMSDPNSPEKEWVELYNADDRGVSIDGFTLYDGVGKIASVTGTIAVSGFKTIYLSSSKLNQSGDLIVLKNSVGSVVDTVSYGDWDDGDTSDNAVLPGKGDSVARVSDGESTEDANHDFAYTITPTPNAPNNITPKAFPVSSSGGGGSSYSTNINQISFTPFADGSVLINELVPSPADGENEFVELYNTTNLIISLDGWIMQDGSLAKTTLSGQLSPHEFTVVEKPKGSLNNTGDLVTLSDPSGKEIDRVIYGSWNGEDGPAVTPTKGSSLIRVNYVDTGEYDKDFFITDTITKGKANTLIQPEIEISKINTTSTESWVSKSGTAAPSGTIFITEIFPNPAGVDDEKEFVELYNSGSSTVNLENWKIGDSTKKYTIENTEIKPWDFYAFYRKETGISLNNSGEETVHLWDPNGVLFDSVLYSGTVHDDQDYSKFGSEWAWTSISTPGEENIRSIEDILPLSTSTSGSSPILYSEDFLPSIVELLPNPVGADALSEYIEFFNPYDRVIILGGLLLDDDDGGSKPYLFPEDSIIPAKSYQAWYSKDTKVSLNNSSDSVRILDPDGGVLKELEYTGAKEGKSYTLGNNIWFWTDELTPGVKNSLVPVTIDQTKKKKIANASKPAVATTLDQVRNYDVGTVTKLAGIVVTEPGTLSSQYLYVGSENGVGLQVYSSKKNFPSVVRGDKVEIAGELSEISGEARLKTQTSTDIHVVGKDTEILPLRSDVSDIGEVYEGGLIEITGDITGIKGSYVYVDDGTDEIRVYIRAGSGIDKSLFKEGARVEITGIVQETKSGYLLSPRDMKDVRFEKGSVKGEKITAPSNTSQPSSKKQILYALLLGLIGVAIILGIKLYGGKIKEIFKKK